MRCYCVLEHGAPLQAIDRATPTPTGTEVLVRTRAAGLCHTDPHLWEGYYDIGGGKRLAFADRGIKPPLTLSHEIVGEVVAVGPDAGKVPLGGTILVHPWIGCGECAACRRGDENHCATPGSLGIMRPGGFADHVLVPHPRYLIDIEGLDPAEAAPLACAGVTTYSALLKFGKALTEDPVVIIGNRRKCELLAREYNVPFEFIGNEDGSADDHKMVQLIDRYQADYVVLARYMRVLPPDTCWKFAGGRIINLHHGLLPSFRGLRPYHDAYAARMLTFGATCHFIVPELDAGNQTINQTTFSVEPGTKLEDVIKQGQQHNEPACLVEGVRRVCDREVQLHFHRVIARKQDSSR